MNESFSLLIVLLSAVCTISVVVCGLAVLVSATNKVIGSIRESAQKPSASVEVEPQPERRQRRKKVQGPACECGESLADVKVLTAVLEDEKTYLVKECPECHAQVKRLEADWAR